MRLCSLRASITQTTVCCTKQKKNEFTAICGNYVIKSDVAATAMPSLWMKLPCDVKRVTLLSMLHVQTITPLPCLQHAFSYEQTTTHKYARFLTIGLTTDINARTSTAVLKFTFGFHHLRRSLIGSIFTIRVFRNAT